MPSLVFRSSLLPAFLLLGAALLPAQTAAPASPQAQPAVSGNGAAAAVVLGDSVNTLSPVIDHLHQVLVSLTPAKWKAPGSVRATAQADIDSMQRDVSNVLPDLLDKAKAAPRAIAPAFALFRNVDALYDVLLRVSETATISGAREDGGRLEAIRVELETARSQLGNAILQASTDQDTEVTQLRSAAQQAAAAARPAPAAKTVVDDGPDATASKKTRARRKKTPPPSTPAPQP